jgi:penicillin G amidase
MNRVMKGRTFVYHLLLTLVLFTQGLMFTPIKAQQKAPAQAGSVLRLAGLKDRVIVRRDERYIPYIESQNEADLYLAQGYLTASDRLWQMDLLRRTARGEMSEIFGRATLEQDKIHRTYGFAAITDLLIKNMPARVRAQFEAYAAGVNAYIDSCDTNCLPIEFRILQYRPRPWRAADSLLIGKLMAESLTTSWQSDLMRAARSDLPNDVREALNNRPSPWDMPIVGSDPSDKKASSYSDTLSDPARFGDKSYATTSGSGTWDEVCLLTETINDSLKRAGLFSSELAASNNWVVSGKRTASGKPLLANDPHLDPSAPSIWYLTHLGMPGLRVAGVTFPGVPGIVIGHNARIAWGMTNLGADVQDVYVETFDKQNAKLYLTPDGWREAEVRHEEIKVRKGVNDPSLETVALDVTTTSHGPIIFEKDSKRYALRWVALDTQASELGAFYSINRARNWMEFREALRGFPGPAQNFIYADVEGHIGYYGAGRVPIRRTGDGSLPYDGAKSDGDWNSFISFEALPRVYDPPSGVIVTANNRIVGLDYANHLTGDWAPPYRARRIFDLLKDKPKLTAEDYRRIQSDIYTISGVNFARQFVKAVRAASQQVNDAGLNETIEGLEKWDGKMTAEAQAPVILSEIRAAFRRRILTAVLGQARAEQASRDISSTFIDYLITEQPRQWLPKEFAGYAELLMACEKDAREALLKRFGPDRSEWKWGRIAVARFVHHLSLIPMTGAKFTIPAFPFNGSNGTFPTVNVGSSVSMRLIADTGDWDKTEQGIALGQSGDPQSPHWVDQLNDWKAVTTRVFPFTKESVMKAQRESLELVPLGQ